MPNRSGKGSAFERRICKILSEWWTQGEPGGPRDDVFWRTSNSGGRATVRGRKGQRTSNQHGDICAVDPIGQPFLDLVTVEIKRGYNRHTIADLLDKPAKAAKQLYETWIDKAAASAKVAGSVSWLLIVQRDRRVPLAIYDDCEHGLGSAVGLSACLMIGDGSTREYIAAPLDSLLECTSPEYAKLMLRKVRGG